MSDNYAVINGRRIKLTDEQAKTLGTKRKNPFDRVSGDDKYYYAIVSGDVLRRIDINDKTDKRLYNATNYFNDRQFAEQTALHQLLDHKLLKYAYNNGFEDTAKWDGTNWHWHILYDHHDNVFNATPNIIFQSSGVHFSSKEGAERAIKEVVEPFMEEHPEFVW